MIATMTRTRSAPLGFFAGLVLTFGLAACGGDGDGGSGSFCTRAKAADTAFGGDFDPTEEGLVDDLVSAMEDMVDVAPSRIKDDLASMLEGMRALEDIDLTDPKAAEDALAGFDEEEMDKASENVGKYLEDKCGIKPT